jgi:hypothetical protein
MTPPAVKNPEYNNLVGQKVQWHVPGPNETFSGPVERVYHAVSLNVDVAIVKLSASFSEMVDCDQLTVVKE